jgi:branched-chain amino acid transport system substrate-binding protein
MTTPIKPNRRAVLAGAGAALAAPAILSKPLWAQGGPIKIGVFLPTSGVLAEPGQACVRGFELAQEVLAEAAGRPMEFSFVDLESRAENGRVAAERLIQEGCSMLIGGFDSGATISAAQVCEQNEIPLLVNIASAPQLTDQGYKWLFRNFTPAPQLVFNAVARIKELNSLTGASPKTAVLMHVNDTFGNGVAGGVNALWDKLGIDMEIVDQISYDLRARDLSVEVAKAKATGADILLPVTRVNDAILIVREMVKQDFNPMGIIGPGSPGPYEKAFTDAVGKFGDEYMVCVPWYDPNKASTQDAIAKYNAKFPDTRFELNVGFSYEAVQIAADAIKRADSADPGDLRAALSSTNLEDHIMFGGPITFDETGQNPNIGGVMLQNQGGEPVVIGPEDAAVAKPIFPFTPFRDR